MKAPEIRTVEIIRYVTPLREGGSLPAIVEADDGFFYVNKFRGAGQGAKALIAELVGGELARSIGLKVPEIVFTQLDPILSRTEGDEEIQDLIRFSGGLNLGLHYLSGAISFDPLVNSIDPVVAAKILWLDALIMNVDRTVRNTNLLIWKRELWLIDHGAALYLHHQHDDLSGLGQKAFPLIKDHVLLPVAHDLKDIDYEIRGILTREKIKALVSIIPDQWLENLSLDPAAVRNAYLDFLDSRIQASEIFIKEILDARKAAV